MKERGKEGPHIAISNVEYVWYAKENLSYFCNLVKGLGVEYVELWPQHLEDGLSVVRQMLDQNGLKVACVNCPVKPNSPELQDWKEEINRSIEVASSLGAKFVSTFLGVHPTRDLFTTIEYYRNEIQPCLEVAQKHRVTILIENECDPQGLELTRTASGTLLLLRAINSDWLQLNFDPCNFYVGGEEPYPYAYQMLKPYIAYIHIKDATRYTPLLHGPEKEHMISASPVGQFVYVPVGEGGVNYAGLLHQLKIDGYKGFLTVEPHTSRERLLPTYNTTIAAIQQWVRI